jgi:hypothetical protein
MSRHFYVEIEKEDIAKRYMQSRAMHAMAAIFMFVYGLQYLLQPEVDWWQLVAIVPPSLLLIALILFKRRLFDDANNNRIFRILEMGFLLMGSMHFLQKNQLLASVVYLLVCAFLGLVFWMESRLFQAQYIDMKEDNLVIELPLRNLQLSWTEVQKVTLKNHYLTFHLRNGKYREFRVKDHFTEEERIGFESLCREKVVG